MEKLIIEYYQSFETKEEKDCFDEKMIAACGRDFDKMNKFYKEYRDTHFAKNVKEYPERLFENMTSIEEVYKFIYEDVNSRLNVIAYPESLNKLKPWIPSYVTEDYKQNFLENANNDKFYYLSEWISRKETDRLFEKLTDEQVEFMTEIFPDKTNEKLIIRFQQNLDSDQQTVEFIEKFYDLSVNGEDAFEFGKKYVNEHCKYVTKEFSEDVFKNMNTMEDVYKFIRSLFLKNNYVACDFLEVPKSFENLVPFNFESSLDKTFITLEDKMNKFSFWILAHVDFHHSEIYKYFLKIKNHNA